MLWLQVQNCAHGKQLRAVLSDAMLQKILSRVKLRKRADDMTRVYGKPHHVDAKLDLLAIRATLRSILLHSRLPVAVLIQMQSPSTRKETSQETLALVNHVLDFIRGNLSNIERVWGRESTQFKDASKIMDQYLDENLKRLDVQRSDLDELMKGLSLDDSNAGTSKR